MYETRRNTYIDELKKIQICKVDFESPICDASLNSTEKELLDKYYDENSIHTKRSLIILGTTLVVTNQTSRIFIQNYFIDSILIFQKYTNIKFVIFTDNEIIIDEFQVNEYNVPILKSIINTLEFNYESWFYGYVNGDILLSLNIQDVMLKIMESMYKKELKQEVIIVSTRSNVQDTFFYNKTFIDDYEYNALLNEAYKNSTYYLPNAIDLFISTKYTLTNHLFDDAVIGRYFIDNYIMDNANFRSEYVDVIDITPSMLTIHMSGNEQYKSVQIESDLKYNQKYFATDKKGYFCDIHLANYMMQKTNNAYVIISSNDESYMLKMKDEYKLLTCYYKYLINDKC
ncbi:hypothetical protein WA158_003696 [Blastocystis sp. Blastoise]